MKRLLLLFSLFYIVPLRAQLPVESTPWIKQTGKLMMNVGYLNTQSNPEEFIHNKLPETVSGLVLLYTKHSPVGVHYYFQQTYQKIPIEGTEVLMNSSETGKVYSILYKTLDTHLWPDFNSNSTHPNTVIFYDGNKPTLAFTEETFENNKHFYSIKTTSNQLLFQLDLNRYAGKDTTTKAFVFFPDPLTSAHHPYGSPYIDSGDASIPELNAERFEKTMTVTIIDDTLYLQNKWFTMVPGSGFNPTVLAKKDVYDFPRSNPSFEDANVWFHLNNFREYVNGLGMDAITNHEMNVNSHYNTDENSDFSYNGSKYDLHFGTGGVDDAEDPDVIIHEYCHSLSHTASPVIPAGERDALEEGLCDYFACSYSKSINKYNWQQLYNWDGHNPFWSGRWCVTGKVYPKNITGSRYKDGELWAGTLMEVDSAIGRDAANKLMFVTMFQLSKSVGMQQAALLFCQNDSILFGGKHIPNMVWNFKNHGLLPMDYYNSIQSPKPNTPKLLTTYFKENGFVYVEYPQPASGTISLYNLQGKQVASTVFNHEKQINLFTENLAQGVYLLRLVADGKDVVVKLVK